MASEGLHWLVCLYSVGNLWWNKVISPRGEVYTSQRLNTSAPATQFLADVLEQAIDKELLSTAEHPDPVMVRIRIDFYKLDELCLKYDLRLSYILRPGQWEPIIPWEENVSRPRVYTTTPAEQQ